MNKPPPDIDSAEWTWSAFRIDVFQLIWWGYDDANNDIRKVHEEEDVTGLIRRAINIRLDTNLPPRFRHYSAHNEDPVDDGGLRGKNRPRVDVLFEHGGSRPRIRFRIESKRCARTVYKSKYTIRWYAQGVKAYVGGQYAIGSPEAGMLGLVQSDDAQYWTAQLATKLEKDSSLACQTALADIVVTPDLADMTVSRHQRTDGSSIDLYHAFVDCKP